MADVAFEESLIELIKNYEWLYNPRRKDFKDSVKKRNAWLEIAALLNSDVAKYKDERDFIPMLETYRRYCRMKTKFTETFGSFASDEVITKEEWKKATRQTKQFNYYDANNDKTVDFNEFYLMYILELRATLLAKRRDFLNEFNDLSQNYCYNLKTGKYDFTYDINADGVIDKNELSSYVNTSRRDLIGVPESGEHKKEIDYLFDSVDVNNDARLTIQYEFQLFCVVDSVRNLMWQKYDIKNKNKNNGASLQGDCNNIFLVNFDPENKHSVNWRQFSSNPLFNLNEGIPKFFVSVKKLILNNYNKLFKDQVLTRSEFNVFCIQAKLREHFMKDSTSIIKDRVPQLRNIMIDYVLDQYLFYKYL